MGLIGGRRCETRWLRTSTAQAIAMSRTLGLADAIDDSCDTLGRTLSPGDVFELMVGAIAAQPERMALQNIREFYEGAPLEALLGKKVDRENLNAMALARGLDAIGAVKNKEDLVWDLAQRSKRRFGLNSKIIHGDGTCFRFTGEPRDKYDVDNHTPIPKHGHPKISDNAKYVQYNAYGIADGDRILSTAKPYDGNISDVTMNKDALDFLEEKTSAKDLVFVADCKLATAGILDRMDGMNIGYVTKIPDNSIDDARTKALKAAVPELYLDEDDGHIRRSVDVTAKVHGADRRFVVLVHMIRFREANDRIRTTVRSELDGIAVKLSKKTFESEEAALEALKSRLGPSKLAGHKVKWSFVEKSVRVKPHQGPDAFNEEYRKVYSIVPEIVYDEDMALMAALSSAATVLITNLDRSPSPDGDVRKGASKEEVVKLYNGQFACEHAFRLMKSGLGLDCIYLQTPQRVDAMLFIVSLAAMMFTLMDAAMRGKGLKVGSTVFQLKILLQNTRMISRDRDWEFEGPPDKEALFFERLDIFLIDPASFLMPRAC